MIFKITFNWLKNNILLSDASSFHFQFLFSKYSNTFLNFHKSSIFLLKKILQWEKSFKKSGTSRVYTTRIYTAVCLARIVLSLQKEMSLARGDLYIRFVRRCESPDILDIRLVNGQVRSRFLRFPIKRSGAPAVSSCIENKSVIFSHFLLSRRVARKYVLDIIGRQIFPFTAISRFSFPLSIEDYSAKILHSGDSPSNSNAVFAGIAGTAYIDFKQCSRCLL